MPPERTRRAVAAIAAAAILGAAAPSLAAGTAAGGQRVALFQAEGFPTVDAPVIPAETLDEALAGLEVVRFASPEALAEGLRAGETDVLVLPYGSAFPVEAWPAIRAFLREGGGLVALGGSPFALPIRRAPGGGAYVSGTRQPTFAHELLLGPADLVTREEIAGPVSMKAPEGSEWANPFPEPARTWALTVRLATRKDLPSEHGSEGPRDAVLRPLVHVLDRDGIPRACPLLMIDRLRGEGAGGRWVLAPSDAPLGVFQIHDAVDLAREGASLVEARPVHASVAPGEPPAIRIAVLRPRPRDGEPTEERARVRVFRSDGAIVFEAWTPLAGTPEQRSGLAAITPAVPLSPGLYRVHVTLESGSWRPRSLFTAFWVRDEALLATGPRLSVSRDWLRRGGSPMPLVGTTYMASDVHRKFLFEPNPHVWDRDFAEMARLGVNFVRTGLWTAWSRAMLDPGAVDEGVVRALEAYVQTAARHGIYVNFTFFAFQPPSFGGSNPFLDPRALEGQKAFLAGIASRFRGVPWVHWDLINEPSYAPADALWTNRPVGDSHERRAWEEWLRARHGEDPLALADAWRDAGGGRELPALDELGWRMIREQRRPRKAIDFVAFSNDVVARWAATLREALRAASGEDTLVTLGQDEGGTGLRPAQQLHAESVDYTAVHTWWANDDLLWDGVVTKVPEKPNVHQETGLMRLEDADGNAWRSPEAAARLLERKLAYALASRGAGVVQWAWNVNPYQPIDNESVIGLFRPDGTAKLELRALRELGAFLAAAAPWLDDFEPDPVVMVIPHARLFSGRPGELEATRRVVRLLGERYGVVPTAISDQRLTAERLAGARLVLVPAPEVIEEPAARALLAASRAGALVLVTGAVEGDPYGRVGEALAALGVVDPGRPVAQHEPTRWGGGWATFDAGAGAWLRRSAREEPAGPGGGLWHEPLPLELAREPEPLAELLGAALRAAGVPTHPSETRVVARVLTGPRAHLVVAVNETASDAVRRVTVDGLPLDVPVAAGRSRLVLVERGLGRVVAVTPGAPLAVGEAAAPSAAGAPPAAP